MPPLKDKFFVNLNYIETLILIIVGWTLVVLWQRCLDNFTFNTLGMNKNSTLHTFIIAFIATVIFLVFIFVFDDILDDFIENDTNPNGTPRYQSPLATIERNLDL